MVNIKYEIERLLDYGEKKGLIDKLDKIIVRNQLLEIFALEVPADEIIYKKLDFHENNLEDILDNMLDYAEYIGLIEKDMIIYRDLLDTKIMGLLTPRQREVTREFNYLKGKFLI